MKNVLRICLVLMGITMVLEQYKSIGIAAPIEDVEYLVLKDKAQARYLRVINKYAGRSPAITKE